MENRESGHEVQGRDRSAHHVFRSSMSDPVYYTRSSMSDPSYPGPQRGMVTPQVNVAEGMTPSHPCFCLHHITPAVQRGCQGVSLCIVSSGRPFALELRSFRLVHKPCKDQDDQRASGVPHNTAQLTVGDASAWHGKLLGGSPGHIPRLARCVLAESMHSASCKAYSL